MVRVEPECGKEERGEGDVEGDEELVEAVTERAECGERDCDEEKEAPESTLNVRF